VRDLFAMSQSGIRDVLLLLAPQAVMVLTAFLTTLLVARGLGPAALGHYGLVLSVAGLASAFSDMGIGQTAIRYAARAAAEGRTAEQMAVLRWALRLRIALVVVVAAALAALAPLIAGRLWHAPACSPRSPRCRSCTTSRSAGSGATRRSRSGRRCSDLTGCWWWARSDAGR
jgi:hypothetical protein